MWIKCWLRHDNIMLTRFDNIMLFETCDIRLMGIWQYNDDWDMTRACYLRYDKNNID